ncbi:MAG: LPS assembly protein LptD [Rickettsiaceae bacterium]|nr:LPS assembly protein LptD [Rickettsiaceae bacterium]
MFYDRARASALESMLGDTNSIIKADKIIYNKADNIVIAKGNVEFLNGDLYITTDEVIIDTLEKKLWVKSEIFAKIAKQKLIASQLFIDGKTKASKMQNVMVKLNDSDVIIAKTIIKKNKEDVLEAYEGAFSPCKVCINNNPLWQINAAQTILDLDKKEVIYRNASLKVAGFKILAVPYFAHPIKGAPPRSGILRPEVYKATLRVPLYLLIKENMDLTYTPRIGGGLLIHEGEFRHVTKLGKYTASGSFIDIKDHRKLPENQRGYHIDTSGKFNSDRLKYGFKFEQVSDKAYIKNYYFDTRSYLKSDMYAYKIDENQYFYGDMQKYQGLRSEDSPGNYPHALPNIIYKKDIYFASGVNMTVKNKFVNYFERDEKNILRNSSEVNINRILDGYYGESWALSIADNLDLYSIKRAKQMSYTIKNKTISRNSPEAHVGLRWPFFVSGSKGGLIIEPQTNCYFGRRRPYKVSKYDLIDSPNIDINENNIFDSSRYSGIDFREYGNRIGYGVNGYIVSNNWTVSGFLGQLIKYDSEVASAKSNYVGKASYSYGDNFELYYRFQKKAKNFASVRDEVLAFVHNDLVSLQNSFTFLDSLFSDYQNSEFFIKDSKTIKQNYTQFSLKMNENATLFGEMRLDLSNKKSPKKLEEGIGVTFKIDCVTSTIKIYRDYTYDLARKIKKNKSISASLSLKSINF